MVGRTPLVRSRPPGRLFQAFRQLILREKSGTGASRADQGVRPTINAGVSLLENYAALGQECLRHCTPSPDLAGDEAQQTIVKFFQGKARLPRGSGRLRHRRMPGGVGQQSGTK